MESFLEETYREVIKTLNECSSKVLNFSDEELKNTLLEELDNNYMDCFHDYTLDFLCKSDVIDPTLKNEITTLRQLIRSTIDNEERRSIESFRNDREWLEIFEKSDKILEKFTKAVYNNFI